MKNTFYLFIILFCLSVDGYSCRYTVREIGFSSLSNSAYSIVIISKQADPFAAQYSSFRRQLADSNIGLIILHPEKDIEHPVMKIAMDQKITIPSTILWSPISERVLDFGHENIQSIVDEVLSSSLRDQISQLFYNHFAFTILVESPEENLNIRSGEILLQACIDITNRMPNMPKQVKHGPEVLRISPDQWTEERILLWSLGLDKIPKSPMAFILYGRGRIIGDILDYEDVVNQEAFKRLAMIGADCECGLDKKWMLGPQIPMNWKLEMRQNLTNELGFDVDNPMVLAEMSHILSKEQINNMETDITFAPEEIDLDLLFGDQTKQEPQDKDLQKKFTPTIIILASLTLLSFIIGILLLRRRK